MTTFVTQAEFARMENKARSYITALKQAGRLVVDGEGRVNVEESRLRIAETADPNRDDVSARHSGVRGSGVEGSDRIGNSYQAARAVKEKFAAMQAKLDYERAIGKLVDRNEMIALVTDIATTLRSAVETLPDRLGPQLASVSNESEVRAILAEQVEIMLDDLSGRFASMSRDD